MEYIATYDPLAFEHSGIKGQKWGVRRFQNEDRTWTEAGKKRYGDGDSHTDHKSTSYGGQTPKDTMGRLERLRNSVAQKQITKEAAQKKADAEKNGEDTDKYVTENKDISQMTNKELKDLAERVKLEAIYSQAMADKAKNEKLAYENQLALSKLNGTYIEPKKKLGEREVVKLLKKNGLNLLDNVLSASGELLVKEMFSDTSISGDIDKIIKKNKNKDQGNKNKDQNTDNKDKNKDSNKSNGSDSSGSKDTHGGNGPDGVLSRKQKTEIDSRRGKGESDDSIAKSMDVGIDLVKEHK